MSQTAQRILVIGGGVIGSVYAAWLQEAGQQVTILARGQRLLDLRAQGLRIADTATGQQVDIPVLTVDHLAQDDDYDLLIVAVRLEQVNTLLPMIKANTGSPAVLFLVNNVFGAEQFPDTLGKDRVMLGFPGIGGQREGTLIKYYVIPQQPTTLGAGSGLMTARVRTLAALIESTGHPVVVTPDMDAWLKTHAIFVTLMAAAIDRCGGDSVRLAHDRTQLATMVLAIHQGFQALHKLGIPITPTNLAVLFNWMPQWFARRYWRSAFQGPMGTLAIAPHARAAHGEMAALAAQVLMLLAPVSATIPTVRQLLAELTQ